MIVYATLIRTADGTPLSATTDFKSDADTAVHEGKRIVKILSRQMMKHPKRVCIQTDHIAIHCVSDENVSYIVVCEPNYPYILAYSFLDELMKEFSVLYTASVVSSVRRPYAFIEFDSFLQKVRQKYNSPRTLASRLNLQDMTNDLNLHPPTYLKKEDIEPPPKPPFPSSQYTTAINLPNGVVPNGVHPSKDSPTVGITVRLKPVTWYGRIAIFLACFCCSLDLYRGAVSFSSSSLEEYDGPSPAHSVIFLIELASMLLQIFFLRKYHKFRKLCTLVCCCLILFLNLFLVDVRDIWILSLYITVSIVLCIATFRRNFERKLPNFNV